MYREPFGAQCLSARGTLSKRSHRPTRDVLLVDPPSWNRSAKRPLAEVESLGSLLPPILPFQIPTALSALLAPLAFSVLLLGPGSGTAVIPSIVIIDEGQTAPRPLPLPTSCYQLRYHHSTSSIMICCTRY